MTIVKAIIKSQLNIFIARLIITLIILFSITMIYFSITSWIDYELTIKYGVEHPNAMNMTSSGQYSTEKQYCLDGITFSKWMLTYSIFTLIATLTYVFVSRKK